MVRGEVDGEVNSTLKVDGEANSTPPHAAVQAGRHPVVRAPNGEDPSEGIPASLPIQRFVAEAPLTKEGPQEQPMTRASGPVASKSAFAMDTREPKTSRKATPMPSAPARGSALVWSALDAAGAESAKPPPRFPPRRYEERGTRPLLMLLDEQAAVPS